MKRRLVVVRDSGGHWVETYAIKSTNDGDAMERVRRDHPLPAGWTLEVYLGGRGPNQ